MCVTQERKGEAWLAQVTAADSERCLWCDEASSEPSWQGVCDRLHHVRGTWNYRRCLRCGSLQLDPLPAPESLASFYPACYDPELPSRSTDPTGQGAHCLLTHSPEGPRSRTADGTQWGRARRLVRQLEQTFFFGLTYRLQARRMVKAIESMRPDGSAAGAAAGRAMLDIGCGRGLRMAEFHRRGFLVEGVDFQAEAVRQVRQQLQLPAWHLDVHEIGGRWPPGSFDLITAFYLLEHVHDLESLVRGCLDLLRPGGALIIAVPLADSCQARLFGNRWSQVTEAPRHLSLPTQAGVQQLMSRVGFAEAPILSDSLLSCSAMAGLSVVPNAAATYGANHPGVRAFVLRAAGAATAALWLPWTWVETYLAQRPAAGLAVAIKPTL